MPAVPPVRMAELVDVFSVCADDYTPAFEAIVERPRTQDEP